MNNKQRSNIILKTLYSYPSMAGLNAESGAMMVASYLEVLCAFPLDVLEEATLKIRRSGEKFAPSAGAIYEECCKLEKDRAFKRLGRWGSEEAHKLEEDRRSRWLAAQPCDGHWNEANCPKTYIEKGSAI